MKQAENLFYNFPNIKSYDLEWVCLNQLLKQWLECGLLIKIGESYQVSIACLNSEKNLLRTFISENRNKEVNTATPLKNVIR